MVVNTLSIYIWLLFFMVKIVNENIIFFIEQSWFAVHSGTCLDTAWLKLVAIAKNKTYFQCCFCSRTSGGGVLNTGIVLAGDSPGGRTQWICLVGTARGWGPPSSTREPAQSTARLSTRQWKAPGTAHSACDPGDRAECRRGSRLHSVWPANFSPHHF